MADFITVETRPPCGHCGGTTFKVQPDAFWTDAGLAVPAHKTEMCANRKCLISREQNNESAISIFNQPFETNELPYDHVITDPVYGDAFPDFACEGNTIAFCSPDAQYAGKWDEYLFWVKPVSTKNTTKRCSRFVEMILVRSGKKRVFNGMASENRLHWSAYKGVYDDVVEGSTIIVKDKPFAWRKPLSLMERLVLLYTNEGDTVFDPFMGTGTTGVACKRHGRKFVGYEIDADRFEIARQRIGN